MIGVEEVFRIHFRKTDTDSAYFEEDSQFSIRKQELLLRTNLILKPDEKELAFEFALNLKSPYLIQRRLNTLFLGL